MTTVMMLYGIPNCNTVKKARTWLDNHGMNYCFHDFKKQGLESELASTWLQQHPWEVLINRAGMTWRNLSDTEQEQVVDNPSALALMLSRHSVIKRPILMLEHRIIAIGFSDALYKPLLK